MISLAPTLPPVELTDSALKLASTLLQIAVDPTATSARLTELATATQTLRDAIALNETTAAKATEVVNAQADQNAKAADLASREDSLLKASTQLSVAAHANASREDGLNAREQALDRREADITARSTALEQRIAGYRSALA